ncbi:MAG: class I SAM-dependent methyltransferase [Actinomycetaceae bacterium]|nr:class I SAM-dependent methyltransferase [Actinomycetaceae bacterium]
MDKKAGALHDDQATLRENPFTRATAEYSRVRPEYPLPVIDELCADIPGVAVDLGAGSGKMTVALAQRGWHVHAIEPSEAMRNQCEVPPECAHLVTLHASTASATGLTATSADLVVAAQSWHWFPADQAAAEAARILRPNGRLAIVFNQMNVEIPWVHRLTRIMRSGDVHRRDRPPQVGECFTQPELHTVDWEQELTCEEVMELGRTRSSWLRQNQEGRARMQENLRWYLYEHLGYSTGQKIHIPYTTLLWVSRLK